MRVNFTVVIWNIEVARVELLRREKTPLSTELLCS